MKYFIRIDDRKYEVDLTGSGTETHISIDGISKNVDYRWLHTEKAMSLIIDGITYTAEFNNVNDECRVTIAGYDLDALVTDERTDAINRMVGAGKSTREALGEIKAPMPGLVVKIDVEQGEKVTKGQGVIVVEAMKMENEIKSPIDGVVEKIPVEPGKAVDKGELLLVIKIN